MAERGVRCRGKQFRPGTAVPASGRSACRGPHRETCNAGSDGCRQTSSERHSFVSTPPRPRRATWGDNVAIFADNSSAGGQPTSALAISSAPSSLVESALDWSPSALLPNWGEAADRIGRMLEGQSDALDATTAGADARPASLESTTASALDNFVATIVEEAVRERAVLLKARVDDAAQALQDELRELQAAQQAMVFSARDNFEKLVNAMDGLSNRVEVLEAWCASPLHRSVSCAHGGAGTTTKELRVSNAEFRRAPAQEEPPASALVKGAAEGAVVQEGLPLRASVEALGWLVAGHRADAQEAWATIRGEVRALGAGIIAAAASSPTTLEGVCPEMGVAMPQVIRDLLGGKHAFGVAASSDALESIGCLRSTLRSRFGACI
eukprot:TRINITY_DN6414_c0_g1_i2.p1 TRINITY_DN6414_c0_g1~~TRINITY_DN6414_c0_g1_i2.p1  ORF type:complete len:382 (-),score=64.49 TRINITY_DN6414_c0_g1_i2:188-1333(-)